MEEHSNYLVIKVEYEKDTFIKKDTIKIFTTHEKTEENNNCPSGEYISVTRDFTCSKCENKILLENGITLYETILM